MAIVNENYTNQFNDGGALPFNNRSPSGSNNQSSNTDSNLVKDYEGKTYDPAVILALSKQIASAVDPTAINGGVFTTKGKSVGFNSDDATTLLGREPNSADQVFLDMARHLAKEGVTDLKTANLSETNRRFGSTYTGGGGTIYEIKKNAEGNPVISTWSKDTSDRGTILGALAIAGLAFGVGSLFGEAASAASGLTGAELASADALLGTVGGVEGAAALAETAGIAGMGAGTGLTAGGSGLGLSSTGGLGLTAAEGLTGTGVLSGSTLGTGLLGGSGTLAGLTGTGILAGSELGTGLLGTTGTQALTGTGVLSGSTLGTELLGTGAGTAATTGGVTGLTNTANLGTGALTTGVDSALLSSYVTPQAMAAKIGANLPQGWESFTPQEKISWFNANNVTAEQLLTAGVPQADVAFMTQNGLGGTVAGMGAGTGITSGAGGIGLKAGTAGLGAEGLGAGITAGTGLTGTGVLTGSTLGTGLLTGAGTAAGLTGTGILSDSTLGTGLLGTGGTTGGVTGGVTGVTDVTGGVTGGVTDGTLGGLGTAVTKAGTGLLGNLTAQQLSGLISGGLSTAGGLLQQQTSREAAQAAQARIDAETAAAKQAAQFRPVGMTTRFGTSQFTYDPVTGQMVSAGYQLTPEAKAQQDRLMALSNQGLTQAEQAQGQFAPLQTGAQSLFNLGNKYLAQTPEEVAQRYINQQMQLLQPSRELELANLQNRLQQQGRAGLSVAQGGNLGATTPELQALYNARAQQELALAAQAQQAGQQQVSFGAGLLGQGAGAMGQYYAGQQAAYAPYTTAMGQAQGLEAIGQQPFALSQGLAQQQAQAGANAGRIGLTGAQLSTALATSNAATTNPYATVLGGLGSPTSLLGQGLANWTTGLLSSPTTAAAGNPLAVGEFANPGYWT